MARDFRAVERGPMLLPPDMLEWLPSNHLAFLVMDVVGSFDLSEVRSQFRLGGRGRQAFDPVMLTMLLVYAYCQGERSSRGIERKCHTDVGFRVVSADQHPDHCTIARFRARCSSQLAGLFAQVLVVCAEAGMAHVGVVSIDGTKIQAQASPRRSYSEERLAKLAEDVLEEAARLDADEDDQFGDRCGDELPDVLAAGQDRRKRIASLTRAIKDRSTRIEAAREQTRVSKQQAVDADVTVVKKKLAAARRARESQIRNRQDTRDKRLVTTARRDRGPIEDYAAVKAAQARIDMLEEELVRARGGHGTHACAVKLRGNPSDPESRLMPISGGKTFVQGYNAQIAVSEDHVIIACDVLQTPNDQTAFIPMMTTTTTMVEHHVKGATVSMILADAGYASVEALTAEGPDRLIAIGRDPDRRPGRQWNHPAATTMATRLQSGSPDREIYRRRGATVETVFGHIKQAMQFTRFSRRGLKPAREEWSLVAAAFNLRRLATTSGYSLR